MAYKPTPEEIACVDGKPISMLESLKARKKSLEEKLQPINEAIEGLEKNPEVNKILDAIERVKQSHNY